MLRFFNFIEARQPFRKLQDLTEADIMVACDWLSEQGHPKGTLDRRQVGYLKPLQNRAYSILSKRFPHLILLRRGGGMMPSRTYYYMFSLDLLDNLCDFLHISKAKHIADDQRVRDYDLLRNIDANEFKNIVSHTLTAHQELFQGKLKGTNAVPRATLDWDLWDDDHYRILYEILPHEGMQIGLVFHRNGLLEIMRQVAQILNARWGASINPVYLIENR